MRDPVDGTLLIAGGSKNNHIVTDMAHIHDFAVKREGKDGVNEILAGIFADVERMRETLLMDGANAVHKLMADEGYALVGELCDGQHFTEGMSMGRWTKVSAEISSHRF